MPDNLKITTSIPGSEAIGRSAPPKAADPTAVINPNLVTAPNTEKQAGKNMNFSFLLNRDSVFSKFVQQLEQIPQFSQSMEKIVFELFSKAGRAARQDAAVPDLYRRASDAMVMDRGQIAQNLEFQAENRTRFSGPVFDILRQIAKEHPDSDFEKHLSPLLKSYNDFFSAGDTTNAVKKELDQIARQIPVPHSAKLKELTKQLSTESPVRNLEKNLTLLKEKIIPLLSRYISGSNDFGRVRDSIALLVHDISRLNVSSRDELADKLTALLDYCKFDLNLPPEKLSELTTAFLDQISENSSEKGNQLYDSLLKLLSEPPDQQHGAARMSSQSLYKSALASLLTDNSVYMPYHHLFLPLNFQGKFLFSEIWIEKDAPRENAPGGAEPAEQPRQILLTFDIKPLGYFEASLSLSGKKVRAHLNCPAELSGNLRGISAAVTEIFSRNGLEPEKVELSAGDPPSVAKQVMKKVQEKRYTIDVSV